MNAKINNLVFKKLRIFFLIFIFHFISIETKAQCSGFDLNFSKCVSLDSSSTISVNNGALSYFTILPPNGSYPPQVGLSISINFNQAGPWTVIAQNIVFPFCGDTFKRLN